MLTGSFYKEVDSQRLRILNTYAPNNSLKIHEAKADVLQEIDKFTIQRFQDLSLNN